MRKTATKTLLAALTLGAMAGLGGCGGGDNGIDSAFGLTGHIRAVNGIGDSPTATANSANPGADVTLSGVDPRLQNIPFPSASGFRTYPTGSYKVVFTVRDTSNNVVTATADNTRIDNDKETTVYSSGQVNSGTQVAFAVQKPISTIPANSVELLPVHDASAAPPVSIYVTSPTATFPDSSLTPTNLSFGQAASSVTVIPSGTYRIRVTQQGQPSNLVFDSGPNGVVLDSTQQYQIAAIDNPTSEGSSSIYLLVIGKDGDSGLKLVNGAN